MANCNHNVLANYTHAEMAAYTHANMTICQKAKALLCNFKANPKRTVFANRIPSISYYKTTAGAAKSAFKGLFNSTKGVASFGYSRLLKWHLTANTGIAASDIHSADVTKGTSAKWSAGAVKEISSSLFVNTKITNAIARILGRLKDISAVYKANAMQGVRTIEKQAIILLQNVSSASKSVYKQAVNVINVSVSKAFNGFYEFTSNIQLISASIRLLVVEYIAEYRVLQPASATHVFKNLQERIDNTAEFVFGRFFQRVLTAQIAFTTAVERQQWYSYIKTLSTVIKAHEGIANKHIYKTTADAKYSLSSISSMQAGKTMDAIMLLGDVFDKQALKYTSSGLAIESKVHLMAGIVRSAILGVRSAVNKDITKTAFTDLMYLHWLEKQMGKITESLLAFTSYKEDTEVSVERDVDIEVSAERVSVVEKNNSTLLHLNLYRILFAAKLFDIGCTIHSARIAVVDMLLESRVYIALTDALKRAYKDVGQAIGVLLTPSTTKGVALLKSAVITLEALSIRGKALHYELTTEFIAWVDVKKAVYADKVSEFTVQGLADKAVGKALQIAIGIVAMFTLIFRDVKQEFYAKIDGVWKSVIALYVKTGDEWKQIVELFGREDGKWRSK